MPGMPDGAAAGQPPHEIFAADVDVAFRTPLGPLLGHRLIRHESNIRPLLVRCRSRSHRGPGYGLRMRDGAPLPGRTPAQMLSQLAYRVFGPLQPTRTRVVLDYHGLLDHPPARWCRLRPGTTSPRAPSPTVSPPSGAPVAGSRYRRRRS